MERLITSLYCLQVWKTLKTRKAVKLGFQCHKLFPHVLCKQVGVLITVLALF